MNRTKSPEANVERSPVTALPIDSERIRNQGRNSLEAATSPVYFGPLGKSNISRTSPEADVDSGTLWNFRKDAEDNTGTAIRPMLPRIDSHIQPDGSCRIEVRIL